MKLIRTLAAASLLSTASFADAPQPAPKSVENSSVAERPILDVVFVLDTTGSMGGLLDGAKQKIWSIASRMASGTPTPRVRVGLVAYRDQGDAYVTRVFQLSEDLDAVYKNLSGFAADGGGDGPEAVHAGLADAVDKMSWSDSKRAAKMIFVVGDAPAHPQDQAALFAASKRAIAKGIVVNSVRCGADPSTESQFRKVASLADGRFDSIAQNGGVVVDATPYDADLSKMNAELTDTAVYAGKSTAIAAGAARMREAKSLAAPAAADRAAYAAKAPAATTPTTSFGAIDLAAAPEQAATVSEDELPANLRAMSKTERVAFAKQQQERRQQIQNDINELAKKRADYLATKNKESKDSFDARVFESVKTSASKAGVAY